MLSFYDDIWVFYCLFWIRVLKVIRVIVVIRVRVVLSWNVWLRVLNSFLFFLLWWLLIMVMRIVVMGEVGYKLVCLC